MWKILSDVNLGDSIAVNGICLTVTEFDANSITVDVMNETLNKTYLGSMKKVIWLILRELCLRMDVLVGILLVDI